MRYYEIINEGYKEVQQKYISAGIDPELIDKTFKSYKDLVNRNQVSGNERNIDWWGKQSFDQLKAFVDEKSSEHSPTQLKRSKIPGKSINLVDNTKWLIVIPLDKNASCFHGKASDWCTTKQTQSHFERYFYDKEIILIYCLNKTNGGMWAIAAHKDTDKIEMFDQKDKSINNETFNSQTGLNVDKIVSMAKIRQPDISSSREVYHEAIRRIKENLSSKFVGRNEKIEKDLFLTRNGELCAAYMEHVGTKEDYPEFIQSIALDYEVELTETDENEDEGDEHPYKYFRALKYIKNPSEQDQLDAIGIHSHSIRYVDDPSEKVQFSAVQQDGKNISYIKKPSEKVQLFVVRQNGTAIKDIIKNGITPSEEVQLAAVQRHGHALQYIVESGIVPTEEVQLSAVNQYGNAIKFITLNGISPSEEVKLAAVNKDGLVIAYIENPSKEIQWAAINQNGGAIRYIIKAGIQPSEKFQLAAVKGDGSMIDYIIRAGITPSEEVQLAAVTQTGRAIRYLIHAGISPSEEMKLIAVKKDRSLIDYIRNPSDEVKKSAGRL